MIDFGVNAAVLGNLSAFYFYAYASLQLPIGVMVDYWGPRRTLVGAALLCGIGSFLFANSDTITGAYVGRFLIGAGAGFTWVGTLTLASQWLPKSRFALVSGMTLMLGMIGAVLGQAPLASAVATFGWRNTLGGAALVAFIISVLIWNILVDKKTIVRPDAKTKITILFDSLKLTIKNPQSWYSAIYGGCMTATMLAFAGLWGVPYLMQVYGIDRIEAAASASLMLIGWGIGAPVAGWISDYLGKRKLPMLVCAFVVLIIFSISIYFSAIPLGINRILLFIYGLFGGGMVVCFAVAREQNRPESSGGTLGFVNTIVMASGAIFQPLIGWLLDFNWEGNVLNGNRVYSLAAYRVAFLCLIASGVIAVVMTFFINETKKPSAEL